MIELSELLNKMDSKMNNEIQRALDKFITENQPNRQISALQPYKKEIIELYLKNYTQSQIVDFLSQSNIFISREALGAFIRKQISPKYKEIRELSTFKDTVKKGNEINSQEKIIKETPTDDDIFSRFEKSRNETTRQKTFKYSPTRT